MKELRTNLCLVLLVSFWQNSVQLNHGTFTDNRSFVFTSLIESYCVKVNKTINLSIYNSEWAVTQ